MTDLPAGVGYQYPAVWLPQLETVLQAFAEQRGLLMALEETVTNLLNTVADEFTELRTAFEQLRAQVQSGQDAEVALSELQARVDAADQAIQQATSEVENLSTAGDEPTTP